MTDSSRTSRLAPAPGDQGAWLKLDQECAQGATYDSNERHPHSKCLPGTRTGVLEKLDGIVDDKSRKIVWLCGESGSGKSTIAHTFADKLKGRKRLAATFFFSRKHKKRSTLDHVLLTFAYQLGLHHPLARKMIADAISNDPALLSTEKSRREQFEKLIVGPLKTLAPVWAGQDGMSMILDALDEGVTNHTSHIRPFVTLLAHLVRNLDLPIHNIIITSRSWPQIRSVMRSSALADIIRIVNVDEYDSRDDVISFFRHAFDEMYDANDLSLFVATPWPSDVDFAMLSDRADGRFIFAATIIRQVDQDQPHTRLPLVCSMLRGNEPPALGNIDDLYAAIIDGVEPSVREKGLEYLSLIVNLAEPLSISDLSRLFSDHVHSYLLPFSALISIPRTDSSDLVQIFHTSLRDFLQTQEQVKHKKASIPPPSTHNLLTSYCFNLMAGLLKRDICGLKDSSLLHVEISNFNERRDNIPRALRYACRHWLYHLQQTSPSDQVYKLLLDFLRYRVLFAIEAFSVFGELGTAVQQFKAARKHVKGWLDPPFMHKDEAMKLLYDSWRLTMDFFDPISASSLHVYESALPCSPKTSTIRLVYSHLLDKASCFAFEDGLYDDWDCVTRVIDTGVRRDVCDYALSPDGSELAALLQDSVSVWDTDTGLLIRSLPSEHDYSTNAIAHGGPYIVFVAYNPRDPGTSREECLLWRPSDDTLAPLDSPPTEEAIGWPRCSHDGSKVSCLFQQRIGDGHQFRLVLRIYNSTTCQQLSHLSLDSIHPPIYATPFSDPRLGWDQVHVEFSFDSSWVMIHAYANPTVLIISPETGRLLDEVNCHCSEPSQRNCLEGIHFIHPNDNSIIHARVRPSGSNLTSTPTAKSTLSSEVQPEMIFYNDTLAGIKLGDKFSGMCGETRTHWKTQIDECIGVVGRFVDIFRQEFLILDLTHAAAGSSPRLCVDPNHPGEEYHLEEDLGRDNVKVYSSETERKTIIVGPDFRTAIMASFSYGILSPKSTYFAIYTESEHSFQIWRLRSGVRTRRIPIRTPPIMTHQHIIKDAQFSTDETVFAVLWLDIEWKVSVYSTEAGELDPISDGSALPVYSNTLVHIANVTRDGVDFWLGNVDDRTFSHLRCNIQHKILDFITKAYSQRLTSNIGWHYKPAHSPNFKRVYVGDSWGGFRLALDLVESDATQAGGKRDDQAKYRVDDSTRSGVFFDEHSWSDLCIDVDGWLRKKQHRICWFPVRYRPVDLAYRGLKLIIDGNQVTILGLPDEKRIKIRLLNTEIEYFDQ